MKWVESIRWGGELGIVAYRETGKIYSDPLARDLYEKKKATARQLSIWKQQNIRMAIRNGYNHTLIGGALCRACGYCFRYRHGCTTCPLYKKTGKPCYELKEFKRVIRVRYRIEIVETYGENIDPIKHIKKNHKEWCIRVGLWKDDWT